MPFFELEAASSKAARSVTALGPRGYEVREGRIKSPLSRAWQQQGGREPPSPPSLPRRQVPACVPHPPLLTLPSCNPTGPGWRGTSASG